MQMSGTEGNKGILNNNGCLCTKQGKTAEWLITEVHLTLNDGFWIPFDIALFILLIMLMISPPKDKTKMRSARDLLHGLFSIENQNKLYSSRPAF